MKRFFAAFVFLMSLAAAALAASGRQPAPPGALPSAPPQYTRFTVSELTRGFLVLSFGSDLHIGAAPRGIRRFDHPIRAAVISAGSVDRAAAMRHVLEDFADQVPSLRLTVVSDAAAADIEVHLIDERDFRPALRGVFGARVARVFIARTDPQCMTSVKSDPGGGIERAISFVIVDKGDGVFRDCAYHELLHAFGLSNHDQHNPWTTLNQKRLVGYLTVYDRALLTLLYDPRIEPGTTAQQARARLPALIDELGLAGATERQVGQ